MKSALPVFVLMLSLSWPVAAQVRTWVSVHGSDAAACSRAAPCRNFAAAIAAVSSGGEVVVLDSGGFGSVLINKPVTILAPEGIHAAIAPTMGNAISVVNPGGPVVLRNLYLNSQGASQGISAGTGSYGLSIRDCVVNGFGLYGMIVLTDATGPVAVTESDFRNNGNTGLRYGGGSPGKMVADRCRFEGNGDGTVSFGTGEVTMRNSMAAGNVNSGFSFIRGSGQQGSLVGCAAANNGIAGIRAHNSNAASTLTVHLEGCTSSANQYGILASGPDATTDVYVAGSTVVFNASGITGIGPGFIHSRGNNTVEHNGAGNSFTDPGFSPK